MSQISTSKTREIIDDFAREISKRKTKGPKPSKVVINFRNERHDGFERDVFWVPVELLLFRKDNGRIRAEVATYEKEHGLLVEKTEEAQDVLRTMLKENDIEKNVELRYSILHEGQREPAIITCDGFLINGNRRKMIIETLPEQQRTKFRDMRVVILPSANDLGGPPTLVEIEQIENRYQHQGEGKAEYSKFNTALSIKRKIDLGMSLVEQMKDDPIYASRSEKEFNKAVKMFEDQYLKPLECIDRYLTHLGRPGLYNTIASGVGDPEGRWQAFLDYYNLVYKKLENAKQRIRLGINEDEIGIIEDVAFKVIRKREFQNLPKAHQIIREFPKWLDIKNQDSKKALLQLKAIDIRLTRDEYIGNDGKEYDERTKDKFWGEKYSTILHRQINKAKNCFEHVKELETPISLLEAALKKLTHDNMQTESVSLTDIPKALEIVRYIWERAQEIESELDHHRMELKKLSEKYNKDK